MSHLGTLSGMTERRRVTMIVVRLAEYGLAALFLYLGVTKLLGPGAAALSRTAMAVAELSVGAMLLIRASNWVSTPAVITVAVAEVVLFNRPPLAAMACVCAHGLTSWARLTLRPHRPPRTPRLAYDMKTGYGLYEDELRPLHRPQPGDSVRRRRK